MNVGDKFLTISYSLLDFQNRPHRYAYRIDGIDKDWYYVNENVIRISSLPYGKFKLHIKAQLESGNWNEQEILIPIHVLKPFYLLFVLFVYLIILYRTRKFKKDSLILEQKVQQRTERLNKALSEKELLLTEIHHRVKNNLQVISGLLELRKSGIEDEKGMAAFNESQSGIMSIAMIHELLYQNENVGKLEFNVILNNIISNVAQLFGREDRKIIFEILPNDFVFNINTTVTLGLIMNELLTNAYKYLPAHKKNKEVE
jgi:signal transduction histidine kinase